MSSEDLALIVFELVVMVLAICLHDMAQAWMANRLGDPTARMLGRITMNPAAHFDMFGMVLWPLIYIWRSPLVLGWGKPVPMTYANFRAKNGELLATLAGPAAQMLAAFLALLVLVVMKHGNPAFNGSLFTAMALSMRNTSVATVGLPPAFPLVLFLYLCILVNVLLAIFNMMPLPFLDGGKILVHFLPYNAGKAFERAGLWLMIGFMFLGFGIILAVFLPVLNVFNHLLFAL
jgi:Zn-dependent protease